ncbi:MAG: EAL domain-containing protein [Pseudomonadota bacterium]
MIAVGVFGVSEGFAGLAQAELIRGALAGAFIVAIAFLAGYAAIRRSGLAVCALLMVLGAGALELSWLGFFSPLSSEVVVMMQALFAAAAIVFLSASIGAARYNPILGGVMFTAALVIAGMGVINFFDRVDLAPLMRWALIGLGGFAVVLSATQALRGDGGARLVLPGVLMAAAAPLLGFFGAADSALIAFASHGLFTLGVLTASIVALTETGPAPLRSGPTLADFGVQASHQDPGRHRRFDSASRERSEIVLDSQIARVLDYSGVGVWDWSEDAVDQTESLPSLLGADSDAPFTPEALKTFIHQDDAARFDSEVLTPIDGPFDVSLKLFDGRFIRLRGARAADEDTGAIERLVAFVEQAGPADNGVNETRLRAATEAAIVPSGVDPMTAKLSDALANGDIVAAFQPIVTLDNEKIAGYEALARWRGQDAGAEEGPERFVRAAEKIGQGGVLAATMLDQAAAFLSEALKKEKRKDLFVAMNVSWGQIREDGFLEAVREAISKYDLPKRALVLELTEADAVSDSSLAADVFRKLKASGVALAFDDFGAGFTCLSNLRKYDFDYLKIDKSFTGDLESGGDGAKIVGSLAGLGKDLGLKVIVEGVESKAASTKARQIGCAFGQGYTFGKPIISEPDKAPEQKLKAAETAADQKIKPLRSEEKKAGDQHVLAGQGQPEEVEKRSANNGEHLSERKALNEKDDVETTANDTPANDRNDDDIDFAEEADDERKSSSRRWRLWGGSRALR